MFEIEDEKRGGVKKSRILPYSLNGMVKLLAEGFGSHKSWTSCQDSITKKRIRFLVR